MDDMIGRTGSGRGRSGLHEILENRSAAVNQASDGVPKMPFEPTTMVGSVYRPAVN